MAGKGHEVRTSDLFRRDFERGEEHRSELRGDTDDPDPAKQHQEDDLEARYDFWSFFSGIFTYRRHVQERITL